MYKDLNKAWAWFVQATRGITEHDFKVLTGEIQNKVAMKLVFQIPLRYLISIDSTPYFLRDVLKISVFVNPKAPAIFINPT